MKLISIGIVEREFDVPSDPLEMATFDTAGVSACWRLVSLSGWMTIGGFAVFLAAWSCI